MIARPAQRSSAFMSFAAATVLALCAFAACSASERARGPFADYARARVTIQSSSGSHTLSAWIADTPVRRTQGLMFVRTLAPDAGMIFFFENPRYVSMWMKNTYVALDMLFIDAQGRIVNIARDARPLSLDTINSAAPVSTVLELAAGAAERLSLQAGDQVSYAQLQP
jgi:uncharacterized membrane protein (UPF0127 family)